MSNEYYEKSLTALRTYRGDPIAPLDLAIAQTPAGDAKGLRFSPHVYNTMEEMDRAVAAVREIAG